MKKLLEFLGPLATGKGVGVLVWFSVFGAVFITAVDFAFFQLNRLQVRC